MAAQGYILIETAAGKTSNVAAALRLLPEVQTAVTVTGPYDVIAVIESPDLTALGALVTGRIHGIAGITRTVTCLAVGGP